MEASGFVALLVAMAASRIINERAMRSLTPEQKVRLIDGFSGARAYSLIPLVLLVGAFWLLSSRPEVDKKYLAIGYFSLLILFVIVQVAFSQRKLGQLDLPQNYRRMFSLAQVVSCLGAAWFFFVMATMSPWRSVSG
jgi:hypothetical protein